MNEIEALQIKVAKSNTIFQIIGCCKEWRDVVARICKKPLRVYQIPLSDKMIEFTLSEGALGNEISSCWSRQSGKTETVSLTNLALGTFYVLFLREDFKVGMFAPVESMITHVTRNRLRERYRPVSKFLEQHGVIQTAGRGVTSSVFILENVNSGSEYYARSLSVGETAEIIGPTFNLMIIEQSELVNALKLVNDVFPMGSTKGGVRILTGTTSPYFKNQYFKDAIIKYNEEPTISRSTSDYVELIDYKKAAKSSPAYRRFVMGERKRLGEDNVAFRTQYGLQWAKTALKFIGYERLATLEQDYTWNIDNLRYFGIDVARAGDSTVLTIIERDGLDIHIIAWLELEGLEFEDYEDYKGRKVQGQLTKLANFMKQYAPLRYGLMDRTSIGISPYDSFKRMLWDDVIDEYTGELIKKVPWARIGAFKASVPENDKMAKAMDMELQHNRIHFPQHTRYKREKSRFIDQMLDLERKYSGHTLKLEAPKGQDRHDDYGISLGLAIYAMVKKSFIGGVSSVNI